MTVLFTPRHGEITIPVWVSDLDSFRQWVHSGELPEKLKVHFIDGQVWVDFVEEAFSHNVVKTAVTFALVGLVRAEKLGVIFSDGMLMTNDYAQLGFEPDLIFISADTISRERIWFTAGETTGAEATEMVGSPDMVLEVVSRSSVGKDTERLMGRYHDAGVFEYWVIDARDEDAPTFTIYRRAAKEFVAVRKSRGWLKSPVFGKSFRLVRTEQFGMTDYVLEVR
jgi:Uma2 family endonuclease